MKKFQLRVIIIDDDAPPTGRQIEVALDRTVADWIIQEEIWSQTRWPEGVRSLADILRTHDGFSLGARLYLQAMLQTQFAMLLDYSYPNDEAEFIEHCKYLDEIANACGVALEEPYEKAATDHIEDNKS